MISVCPVDYLFFRAEFLLDRPFDCGEVWARIADGVAVFHAGGKNDGLCPTVDHHLGSGDCLLAGTPSTGQESDNLNRPGFLKRQSPFPGNLEIGTAWTYVFGQLTSNDAYLHTSSSSLLCVLITTKLPSPKTSRTVTSVGSPGNRVCRYEKSAMPVLCSYTTKSLTE